MGEGAVRWIRRRLVWWVWHFSEAKQILKCQESRLLSVQEAVEEESSESNMKCGEMHENMHFKEQIFWEAVAVKMEDKVLAEMCILLFFPCVTHYC